MNLRYPAAPGFMVVDLLALFIFGISVNESFNNASKFLVGHFLFLREKLFLPFVNAAFYSVIDF